MYIEYYILENLLINYIIISCTSMITKNNSSIKIKLIGASIGAMYSVMYLFTKMDMFFTIPAKFIFMILIVFLVYGYENKRKSINIFLIFYMVNIFVCGSSYFIIYFTGMESMKVSIIILCAYISCELLKHIYTEIKEISYLKRISENIKISMLGKECECKTILDSGNLLKDPISNNRVMIVNAKTLQDILPKELSEIDYDEITPNIIDRIMDDLNITIYSRIKVIPYTHGGSSKTNLLLGIKPDYIEVDNRKINNVIVGISNFVDNEYQAIVNPEVLSQI